MLAYEIQISHDNRTRITTQSDYAALFSEIHGDEAQRRFGAYHIAATARPRVFNNIYVRRVYINTLDCGEESTAAASNLVK